jgi:hypothetical protein
VQEFRELFSQRLIAFGFVPCNLAVARQLAPCFNHSASQGKCEAIFVHNASMQIDTRGFQERGRPQAHTLEARSRRSVI